jgi:hypothetical protein
MNQGCYQHVALCLLLETLLAQGESSMQAHCQLDQPDFVS